MTDNSPGSDLQKNAASDKSALSPKAAETHCQPNVLGHRFIHIRFLYRTGRRWIKRSTTALRTFEKSSAIVAVAPEPTSCPCATVALHELSQRTSQLMQPTLRRNICGTHFSNGEQGFSRDNSEVTQCSSIEISLVISSVLNPIAEGCRTPGRKATS